MGALTLQRAKTRLIRELTSWQIAAIGLLVLSVLVNTAMAAWITSLEVWRQEEAAQYREQIEEAEHIRDLAVQELGAMALQQTKEQEARAVQAAAYEAAGIYTYIGNCTITAYCCEPYKHICGNGDGITAAGLPVAPGMVAVDPEVIPLGSTVIIDGQKYLAADTGVTGLWVDVAVPTHDEALALGIWTADVWIETERSVPYDYDQ